MASRSERRESARLEAVFKLVLLGFFLLAFAIGGLSGFASALTALVFLAVVVVATGLASFLILKSRLVCRKKIGLLLIIPALLMAWYWNGARAPKQWPEARATVASISGPTAITETDYAYRTDGTKNGATLLTTQTKSWAKLSEANKHRPGPTVVYFNRTSPNEVHFEPTNGWVRTSANPLSTRIRVTGEGTATLRIGSALFPRTATTTGPHVAGYTVGATLPVWINPVSGTELSFQPRTTDGGQKYWMLALAGALAVGGVLALVTGKQWLDPSNPPPPIQFFASTGTSRVSSSSTSITERLRAIDWFQFEAVAARIMELDGWAVQKSGGANPDGGADILAIRNGRKAVIQCKHWRHIDVQPKIIRELIGTRTSVQFAADEAILFTLSNCTDAALACARENNVIIFNSDLIAAAIERHGLERFPELTNPDDKRCPKCGAAMVLRDKVATPFWGCSTYPRCRGTFERVSGKLQS